METLLLMILLLILTLVQVIILVGTAMFIYGNIVSSVPLVPVKQNALNTIISALELQPGSTLYDLGSGDGRVLNAALATNSKIKAIGLEVAPWPRVISKIKLRKYGSNAEVRNQDFFKADFRGATHIYMYLYPSVMEKLEPIFDRMITSGTRIVSCDFPFPNKIPQQTITIPNNKKISKTLYVYIW